jgi:3-oxoacyl-[acyl-carrier protein] reductase
MDLGIAGKVALVTASSKGLGRASAQALSEEGVSVTISARNRQELEAAAATMPGDVLAVPSDVTDPSVPQRLVDATVERFGRLDILVANAGGPPPGRALDLDDDSIAAAVNANLVTSVRLVRAAVPHMRARGWGRICLITSASVKQPITTLALSNTARTGLWAWAKTAAADLLPEGITLNLACPGLHATDRATSLYGEDAASMRIGDPGDFGRVVAFLCSASAGFVSGAALQVDGAATLGLL